MKKFLIVYFSGTQGTRRVAQAFYNQAKENHIEVDIAALDISPSNRENRYSHERLKGVDFLLLLFPVYALDAPKPVYDWLDALASVETRPKRAAVVSVSGGGEMWPNTGCRCGSIQMLEQLGVCVSYEHMLIMPSNAILRVDDHTAMHVLNVMPTKVAAIMRDLLQGVTRLTHSRRSPIKKRLSQFERDEAATFATKLHCSNKCNGCGWCASQCPTGNITILNKKPNFSNVCTICLRCIYGCPQQALSSKYFFVFREGYSLESLEARLQGVTLQPIKALAKGLAWLGVKKYLNE